MASYITRGGVFGLRNVARTQTVPLSSRTSAIDIVSEKQTPILDLKKQLITPQSRSSLFVNKSQQFDVVKCGLNVPMQVRYAHTDVTNVPSFDAYRHKNSLDPNKKASDSEVDRKMYKYLAVFPFAVTGTYMAKGAVQTFISYLAPSAKTLAEGTTEIALSTIPEGKSVVVKWRSKPLFVRHRTQAEIEREQNTDLAELRDPQKDEHRVQKPEWLVVLGICTHLGCVPIANAGDFGGYFCPCHGSHYDASGRIRKGPAPLNLEIPEYKFVDDDTLVVG